MTKSFLEMLFPLIILINSCGQTTTSKQRSIPNNSSQDTAKDLIVGGPCDGCDVMFYGGKPG